MIRIRTQDVSTNTTDDAADAWRIVLIYAVFASVWILVSDSLLSILITEAKDISRISMYKGWSFVLATTLLLFSLVRRMQISIAAISQREIDALREQEHTRQLMNNIVESSSDIIYAKDVHGKYLLFNKVATSTFGIVQDQVLGFTDSMLFPEQARQMRENDERVISERRLISYEESITTSSGNRIFWATKGPLLSSSGNVVGVFCISRDITDRKKAEQILIESDLRTRAVIQAMPNLVWLKDANGVYLSCNRRFEEFFGASEESIIGKTDFDFVSSELAEHFRHHDRLAMEGLGPRSNEEWITFASDGHKELLETTKTPVFNAEGEVIGVLGVGHNITQRQLLHDRLKVANDTLDVLNEHLEAKVAQRTEEVIRLYDQAPCGYHSLSPSGVILRVNKTELAFLGYSEDEYVGHPIIEFLTPESAQLFEPSFAKLIEVGFIRNLELDFVCKNGEIRSFLVDANLVYGSDGEPLLTSSTMVDNSERKASERQIQDLNKLLHQVVESMPYGVLVLDDEGLIKLKNQNAVRLLGYPDDYFDQGIVGYKDMVRFQWARGDYGARSLEEMLAYFEEAMLTRQGIKLERQQSNGIYLEVCGEPLDEEWTLLTYTDITSHNLAQQTLDRAMHAAQAATAAKNAFIANVSHELRTPMNAILGLSYLLEKTHLPVDAAELVHKIRTAGSLLLAMLNDVLDFTKIESGKLVIQLVPFRLNDVLDNLASIMSINSKGQNLELVISPPCVGFDELVGDSMRIEQVLVNLTGNAIKFTATGHVALSITTLATDSESATLRFSVQDSGIGISDEHLQEIFSEFSQVDGSTSRKYGGTGLGLTLCQRLVEAMGGTLNVTSQIGLGSEFSFTLRLKRSTCGGAVKRDIDPLSVVIADDHAMAREATRAIATGLGWHATSCDSGFEVLEHLKSNARSHHGEQVLLLDFDMPGLDGLFTAHAAQQANPSSSDLNVILVTASNHENLRAHPYASLADAILIKPVTPTSLLSAVNKALVARKGSGQPVREQSVTRLTGVRLLVVDDNEINLEVAQRIFAREGALVATACDGMAALDWLNHHADEVDIVLMDIQMPLMNGYEATRKIRDLKQLENLPVVALTAGAMVQHQQWAIQAGMNGYIAKPFDVDSAVELILSLVGPVDSTLTVPKGVVSATPESALVDLPGLSIGHAIAVWRDEVPYKKFLRRFVDHYSNIVEVLRDAEDIDAKALVHKFRGAAANLGMKDVAAASLALEHAIEDAGDTSQAMNELHDAMQMALASIDRYAPATNESSVATPLQQERHSPARHFETLLRAWQSDSSVEVETALAEVGQLLPSQALTLQQTLLDSYDFRAGETATLAIMRDKLHNP